MVLRGSKTRPDTSLEDAQQAIARANKYLRQTRRELQKAKNDGYNTLRKIERRDSDGTSVVTRELTEILRVLLETIKKHEEKEKSPDCDATSARQLSYNYITTVQQGMAGATARTFVAPIDRVKILMQTQEITRNDGRMLYTSVSQSLRYIIKMKVYRIYGAATV